MGIPKTKKTMCLLAFSALLYYLAYFLFSYERCPEVLALFLNTRSNHITVPASIVVPGMKTIIPSWIMYPSPD